MEPNTIQVGDVLEIERDISAPRDQPSCHLRCLDGSGRELTLTMSLATARKLFSLMHHALNVKE